MSRAPSKKPKVVLPHEQVLSTQHMALMLGVTTRWLQIMAKEGRIPSRGRGKFIAGEVVQAWGALKENAADKKVGSASLDELRAEKALTERQNRMRRDRELITLDEAMGFVDEVTGLFVASLSGLPAQITGVPRERQRLDGIFDTERQRLADRFAKTRAALLSGDKATDAEDEDDA